MLLRLARALLLAMSVLLVMSVSVVFAEARPQADISTVASPSSQAAVPQALKFIAFQPLRSLRVESAAALDDDLPPPRTLLCLLQSAATRFWLWALLAGLLPCLALLGQAVHWRRVFAWRVMRQIHPRHLQFRFLHARPA